MLLERGDLIELLVRQLNESRGQSKGAIHLRIQGAVTALVADVVLEFRPGVLQDRAHLDFEAHAGVLGEILVVLDHLHHEVVRAVAEAAGDAGLSRLVDAAQHRESFPQRRQRDGNFRGVEYRHAHPHQIVDVGPRLGVGQAPVLPALTGLGLERGPGLDPGGHGVEGDAGVVEQVLDGGGELLGGRRMLADPLVVARTEEADRF